MRGAPGATDGTAQVYVGVFSPSRGTYQLQRPGRRAAVSPRSTATSSAATARPAPSTSCRAIPAQGPRPRRRVRVAADDPRRDRRSASRWSRPTCGSRTATSRAPSRTPPPRRLEQPAVVLGGTVAVLDDLAPGASPPSTPLAAVNVRPAAVGPDRRPGVLRRRELSSTTPTSTCSSRHTIVDQLTYDPNCGLHRPAVRRRRRSCSPGARTSLLPVEIEGQTPRRDRQRPVLPAGRAHGPGHDHVPRDLLALDRRSTSDAQFFSKDPCSISFGGAARPSSYRPIAFDGRSTPTELAIGLNFGGDPAQVRRPEADRAARRRSPRPARTRRRPIAGRPASTALPEVELFDLDAQATGSACRT